MKYGSNVFQIFGFLVNTRFKWIEEAKLMFQLLAKTIVEKCSRLLK